MEEADGPGDSAWEGSATATAGTTEVSSTVVAFTIDQVAASVSMTKLGDPAPTEDVQELAQKLASRIEAVAARTVTDTPVPVPTETTTTTTTPQQDPALERMVLALKDLPFGVSVKNEGYVTGGDDVSFQRDFALGNTKVGKSELIGLQSNAERMDSAAEAAVAVKAVSGAVKGPAGRKLFAESFAKGAGFSAESLRDQRAARRGDRRRGHRVARDVRNSASAPSKRSSCSSPRAAQPARSMRPARRARSPPRTSSGSPGRWRGR